MGGVPDGVRLIFWPGIDTLPADSGQAEVVVAPWWAGKSALGLLTELPSLKLVQILGAGHDWIAPWVPAGVALANNPGINAGPVAEWVLAATLTMLRDFPAFGADQRARQWRQRPTGELAGRRALIVGYGAIGQRIAALLRAFDADVTVAARHGRPGVHGAEQIPRLLRDADIVVVVIPLDDTTRRMVDAQFLAAMPDGALLINAARGAVVDTGALAAELKAGRLRAALDVTDPEPLPPDHELWGLPGVLITPHVASAVPSFLPDSYRRIRAQLVRMAAGLPPEHVVPR
jgi:phosphoglycerate dehydrogenase-like enzyme